MNIFIYFHYHFSSMGKFVGLIIHSQHRYSSIFSSFDFNNLLSNRKRMNFVTIERTLNLSLSLSFPRKSEPMNGFARKTKCVVESFPVNRRKKTNRLPLCRSDKFLASSFLSWPLLTWTLFIHRWITVDHCMRHRY